MLRDDLSSRHIEPKQSKAKAYTFAAKTCAYQNGIEAADTSKINYWALYMKLRNYNTDAAEARHIINQASERNIIM